MKTKFIFFILFITVAFTACQNGGSTGLLVPADAALVVHINFNSLSSKLTWKEIQQTAWYSESQVEINDSLAKKLLADPASSGINTNSNMVLFMKRSNPNGYVAIVGEMKDIEKFKSSLQQVAKGSVRIEKDGNLDYASFENNSQSVLYFNNKNFVFITDASNTKKMAINSSLPDLSGNSSGYTLDSLRYFAKHTFNLKGKDLLDSDKRFANLINNKADIHYWINTSSLYEGLLTGPMAMMKIGDVLQGNISSGTANFEDSKITLNNQQFYGKQLAELFGKYKGKNVSNDLLNKLPAQNVLMAFAMNFNPDGIKEFLKVLGVDGMANAAMAQFGFSVDEFIKAQAGELAFALTDFSIKKVPQSITLEDGETIHYEDEKPDMKFVFATSVNDKNAYQKMVDVIEKQAAKGMSVMDSSGSKLQYILQDKWFALGSSKTEVNAFLTNNKKPDYSNIFDGHNGGGYIDLQKLIVAASAGNKDSSTQKAIQISADFWKDIQMIWDVKGGITDSKIEINLSETKTNSLKQLNKYIDRIYLSLPKNKYEEINIEADANAPMPEPPPPVEELKK
ncbi:MAG: DUF4836 family protein [Niabella sp.]